MQSLRVQQDIAMGKISEKMQSKGKQEMITGDFFAAFLQLLMQGSEDGQTDLFSQMANSDEDENVMAMEMMADLLGGNMDLFANDSFKNLIELSQIGNNPQMLQQLMTIQNGNGKLPIDELNLILSELTDLPNQDVKVNIDFKNQMLNLGNTQEMQAKIIANNLNPQEAQNSSELLLKGNMNFQNAVLQAQKLIKGESKSNSDISNEVFSINQSVDQPKFDTVLNENQVLPQETKVDIPDLIDQVKNGISNAEFTEQKEFSVKLKPEGLGEVVIKLIENENKLTVNIVTATSEVAKLLNSELSTLKQSMKAMHVDVRDVVVEQQNDFSDLNQNLHHQMFQGQSNQFGRNNSQSSFFSSFSSSEEELFDNAQPQRLKTQGMDFYA